MLQAANLLGKKNPGEFTMAELTDHVDDLLERFQNKSLGDTIFRLGCDLQRKLGSDDRLAGGIHPINPDYLHCFAVAIFGQKKYEQGSTDVCTGCTMEAVGFIPQVIFRSA